MLEGEMDGHLGYSKHSSEGVGSPLLGLIKIRRFH
jgi:hypothetical protein